MKAIALLSALLLMNLLSDNKKNPGDIPPVGESEPIFSFGIVSDVQYCECPPAGTRYYRNSLSKLIEAYEVFKNDSLEFIVNLGDFIDRDFDSYKPLLQIIDGSGLRTIHLTGNHDYQVEPRMKKRIPQLENERTGYFSSSHHGYRFIFLNGNEISTYGSVSKRSIREAAAILADMTDNGEINAMEWNGGISNNQLEWFDAQVTDAEFRNEKVVVFCHFPVYPEDKHNLLNSKEVLKVLEKHKNVIAWFSGHNHAGNYGNVNMIHFVTLKGMVETEEKNSFARVDIYNNKIWITGYGSEKSQILAY